MSEYVLTIVKRSPNPDYVAPRMGVDPYQTWRDDRTPTQMSEYVETTALSVTVDEATFAAIRKAAVETL